MNKTLVRIVIVATLAFTQTIVGNPTAASPDTEFTRVGELEGFERGILELDDGGRMNHYLRKSSGPTLVLVPGTWGGIWRFESLIEKLPHTMSIAVVELSWQDGKSPPSLDMTIEQLSDDVLRAIRVMGLENFVIAGHSIGGMIAVEIAGREIPGLVGAIPMEGWTHYTVAKTAFAGVVTNNLTPEEEAWRKADRARGLGHLPDKEAKAIGTIWRKWNGYAGLERSTIPILEIWGDRSTVRPDLEALQIPERPNIEIAWVKDASHRVLIEEPAEVARMVNRFMAKVRVS